MKNNNKVLVIVWILISLFLINAFLPVLQFSFNSRPVNLFGICEEFASRDRAGLRHFAPLGYITFAFIVIAVFTQILFLLRAIKKPEKEKSARTFSIVMIVVSLVFYIGFLLLVSGRSNFSLTMIPFLFLALGIAYIPLSGMIHQNSPD